MAETMTRGISLSRALSSTSPIAWGMVSKPANQNGVVAKIHATTGQAVDAGDVLVEFES